ncbi:GNAT family N-acetyltransferase [Roseibium sp.]|uniref:GNAT family N-acetyltransferase n=1 Tax=Roseibium sp. TaxID=1936156 RepID=UPI003B52AE78
MMPTEIQAQRLVLRPLAMSDVARIVELAGNFEVAKMLGVVPHPYSAKDAEDWIRQTFSFVEGGERAFAIDDGSGLIGSISLGKPGKTASLGYWLGEPYWGNGYMGEAVKAVLEWFFSTTDEELVVSGALDENTGSQKILEKAGFGQNELRLLHIPSRGVELPASRVFLTRNEFEARRQVA